MECNQREHQRFNSAESFKGIWHDWVQCEKEYLYRYVCDSKDETKSMVEVVESFRPHKANRGTNVSSPNNNPAEHEFLSGLYE